eukprot:scaffold32377_cov60-Phaeocystis_antarctica.AAC.2
MPSHSSSPSSSSWNRCSGALASRLPLLSWKVTCSSEEFSDTSTVCVLWLKITKDVRPSESPVSTCGTSALPEVDMSAGWTPSESPGTNRPPPSPPTPLPSPPRFAAGGMRADRPQSAAPPQTYQQGAMGGNIIATKK